VAAAEVSLAELRSGKQALSEKIAQYRPRNVAFLSKVAYRAVFNCKEVQWGHQPTQLHGASIWVLPNPSGLNRRFRLDDLVRAYGDLHRACQ
jgi:TDG/mug DNA glycosylase family protein